jgi:hypothetical protein
VARAWGPPEGAGSWGPSLAHALLLRSLRWVLALAAVDVDTPVLAGTGGGGMVPGCLVPRPAPASISPSGLCTPCTVALAAAPLLTISTAKACT